MSVLKLPTERTFSKSYDLESVLNNTKINELATEWGLGDQNPYFKVVYTLNYNQALVPRLNSTELKLVYYLETELLPQLKLAGCKGEPNSLKLYPIYTSLQTLQPVPKDYSTAISNFIASFGPSECPTTKTDNKISLRREFVIGKLRRDYDQISLPLLRKSFDEIDQLYFDASLRRRIEKLGYRLEFEVSTRLAKTAGKFGVRHRQKKFFIRMATFFDQLNGKRICNGVICDDMISCFVITLQHEIVHLIVRLEIMEQRINVSTNPDYSGHNHRFMQLAREYFGLTKNTHDLFKDISSVTKSAEPLKTKADFQTGDVVSFFERKRNKTMEGKIVRLNAARASVMVNGMRWLIPYQMLTKIEAPSLEQTRTIKDTFSRGDLVSFTTSNDKKLLRGKINRLNPSRASIKVDNMTWRVPYRMLTKIEPPKSPKKPISSRIHKLDFSKPPHDFKVGDVVTYVKNEYRKADPRRDKVGIVKETEFLTIRVDKGKSIPSLVDHDLATLLGKSDDEIKIDLGTSVLYTTNSTYQVGYIYDLARDGTYSVRGLNRIVQTIPKSGIIVSFEPMGDFAALMSRFKTEYQPKPKPKPKSLTVGTKVEFKYKSNTIEGEIIRINKKSLTVQADDGKKYYKQASALTPV